MHTHARTHRILEEHVMMMALITSWHIELPTWHTWSVYYHCTQHTMHELRPCQTVTRQWVQEGSVRKSIHRNTHTQLVTKLHYTTHTSLHGVLYRCDWVQLIGTHNWVMLSCSHDMSYETYLFTDNRSTGTSPKFSGGLMEYMHCSFWFRTSDSLSWYYNDFNFSCIMIL